MRPAVEPIQRPRKAKLLVVDAEHHVIHAPRSRLADFLAPGDLLVANDAATIPASLTGTHVRTGRTIEVRLAGRGTLNTNQVREFVAVVFGDGDHRMRTEDRPPPPRLVAGDTLQLGPLDASVLRALGHPRFVALAFDAAADTIWAGIALHGRPIQYSHLTEPLGLSDVSTRIAALPVAFEAPSAGFLLDWRLLDTLRARRVDFATLTHAAGISSTGDPELDARLPIDEPYDIPARTVQAVETTRRRRGRVIGVGTTVTRALEHAASIEGGLRAGPAIANQRIGPHSILRVVDGIITGTHETGDSHFELLRAFAGDDVLRGVSGALERGDYRTHEFGDSVFLVRQRARTRVSSRRCLAANAA